MTDYTKNNNEIVIKNKIGDLAVQLEELLYNEIGEYPVQHHIIIDEINMLLKRISEGTINKCVGCGEDMGINNPRQYCCKTWCPSITISNNISTNPNTDK